VRKKARENLNYKLGRRRWDQTADALGNFRSGHSDDRWGYRKQGQISLKSFQRGASKGWKYKRVHRKKKTKRLGMLKCSISRKREDFKKNNHASIEQKKNQKIKHNKKEGGNKMRLRECIWGRRLKNSGNGTKAKNKREGETTQ